MKIFKDKFIEWLDKEINDTLSPSRKRALQEAKAKLQEVIKEEYAKIVAEKETSAA